MTIAVDASGGFAALNFYQNDDARTFFDFPSGDLNAYPSLILEMRKGTRLEAPLVKRLELGDGLTIESATSLTTNLTTDQSGVFWLALVGTVGDGIGVTLARGKIIVTAQITRI